MKITKLESVDFDIVQYELVMARMPGFAMVGNELRDYLNKMVTNGCVFVGESEQGNLLGLIGGYANDHILQMAYVSSFVVAQAVEGKGVASQLFERFCVSAKSAGMHAVSLNVRKDNPRAIAFYSKMGLCVVGQGRDDDHWLMSGEIC